MNARNYIWILAGAALVAALAICLVSPDASATNDPPVGGGTVTGTWTVTDTRTYTSVSITVNSGDIVIQNGGSLTLTTVTLYVNPGTEGRYGIDVQAGGTLKTQGGSITGTPHYKFSITGTATLNATTILEMWGDNASWKGGIQCYSDNIVISNCSIYNGKTGGISIFNCTPTIFRNTVYNNGADGASPVYVYGIYGIGTRSNITFNTVMNNTNYALDSIYQITSNIYPNGGGTFWNGNWYYDYGTYAYRYFYNYVYGIYKFYGTGIFIDSGSNPLIDNNTVVCNGWSSTYYIYTYIPTTYEDVNYHYYWGYNYSYMGIRSVGVGIRIDNSNANITSNQVNRNGYQPSISYIQQIPHCQEGSDVKLDNSSANINNNTLQDSVFLINLYKSSANITNNRMQGLVYQGGITRGKVVAGININKCTDGVYIYNNTIRISFSDSYYYDQGQAKYLYAANYVVGVNITESKKVVVEFCRITTEATVYGAPAGVSVNASLRCTDIRVLNCTLTHISGANNPGYIAADSPAGMVAAYFLSDIVVENCTIKGGRATAASVGNQFVQNGLYTNFGSSITVRWGTISNLDNGGLTADYGKMTLRELNITNCWRTGFAAEYYSKASLTRVSITNSLTGVKAVASQITVQDCAFSNTNEFTVDVAASIEVLNTTHNKGTVTMLDLASWVNVSWLVKIHVNWQNGLPVDGATVTINNITQSAVFQGITDASGYPTDSVWVKDYQAHLMSITKHTPHKIVVSKGRLTAMDLYILDGPLDVNFRLIDNIPPSLTILTPRDKSQQNVDTVNFKGEVSDSESGLQSGQVEFNIDNQGWSALTVENGRWNATRVLSDGPHVVRVRAFDLTGNSELASVSFVIDTVGPSISIFNPVEGCYTNQRTITVTGISEEDAQVSVNGIRVTLDKRYFATQVSLEEGPNTLTVTAVDPAGNFRSVEVHLTLDATAPILEIMSPANGSYTSQDPESIIGTTEHGARVFVNGIPAQVLSGTFESLLELSEGANTVHVLVTDLAGNSRELSFIVYLDTVAPDLSVFTPLDQSWTNLSRIFVSGATEAGASVTVNKGSVNVANSIFSTYVSLTEGANRISITARDGAGNIHTFYRTVYLDTRTPDLVLTSPQDRSIHSVRVVPVTGSVDFSATVRVNGVRVPVTDFVFSTTVLFPEDGLQVIEVTATDMAGNTVAITRTVILDTKSPVVTISFPENNLKVSTQKVIYISGQTEPFSTVVVNTEIVVAVGRDGLFSVPVALEYGENRITVTSTDSAGNSGTNSVTILKATPVVAPKQDTTWALNLSGLLMGIGVAFPIGAYLLAESWRRRRTTVMAEMEATRPEQEARTRPMYQRPSAPEGPAALPPLPPEVGTSAIAQAPQTAPEMASLPTPEETPGMPGAQKKDMRAKSTTTEVSAEDTEMTGGMRMRPSPAAPAAPTQPVDEKSTMNAKYTETEQDAGATEIPSNYRRR